MPSRVWRGVAHLPVVRVRVAAGVLSFPKTELQQDEPLPYVAEVLHRGKYVGRQPNARATR